jgi:hypothetical protein
MPRPPSPEERKQVGFRLSVRLMKELRHLAVDEDKNLNDLVEEAIQDLLKKYKEMLKETRKR